MGGKISVQLSIDEAREVADKTGFSVAQVNKLYHRLVYLEINKPGYFKLITIF